MANLQLPSQARLPLTLLLSFIKKGDPWPPTGSPYIYAIIGQNLS
jgi:hypothetical protein